MKQSQILLSFVGNHDPFGDTEGSYGPLLSLLETRTYNQVFLLWTASDYLNRAKIVEKETKSFSPGTKFFHVPVEVESVIDYIELFQKIELAVQSIQDRYDVADAAWSILLDPGTPQMQTCWFLLVKSGILAATLLQGTPARFTGGIYKVREIDVEDKTLPKVSFQDKESFLTNPVIQLSSGIVSSESKAVKNLYDKAYSCARYDTTVLIEGETGTGKEVIAREIHDKSPRKDDPFYPINCASIPAPLAESQLFGHIKGAFTGAISDSPGAFRAADKGTLFLDEVGELPLEIQPKLLRCLDNHEVQPVGAPKTENFDVRIIAATNKDLAQMVIDGTFREDLYQRLNEVKLQTVPLRERKEDISILFSAFLEDWNIKYSENRSISEEAMGFLKDYNWPRNIRQLKAASKEMCSLARSQKLTVENLSDDIKEYFNHKAPHSDLTIEIPEEGLNLKALLLQIEARYYRLAMEKTEGNAEQAAGLLGINPPAFRKALRDRIELI